MNKVALRTGWFAVALSVALSPASGMAKAPKAAVAQTSTTTATSTSSAPPAATTQAATVTTDTTTTTPPKKVKSATTRDKKPPAQRSSGPLGDFVPCLFTDDQKYDMHGIPRPAGNNATVDQATVYRVIRETKAALETASLNAFHTNPALKKELQPLGAGIATGAAATVAKTYEDNLLAQAPTLVGKTQKELLLHVSDAAASAVREAQTEIFNQANKELLVPLSEPDLNNLVTAAVSAVVVSATNVVSNSRFKPPDDVSCSMAILTWQETSDIFGRRVANTYIAIQVTVRNLNKTNEFLIHDIQVAVDTGLAPADFSRFQAGRDKLLVRAVAERGQTQDRRNLALNSLLAVGAIASAVTPLAPATEFATAVAVFQGGFIPGFKTLFPDHTVEQLNNINDRAFSASSVNKVIVPIEGSVPLVTFISVKPVEQMPFAWCGYNKQTRTYLGHANSQECKSGSSPATTAKDYPETTQDSLDYKKWQPAALRILQDHTFVVIGGVHIKQLTNEPGTLSGITCPKLPSGSIDISKPDKDGSIACKVTGTSLKSITAVKLTQDDAEIVGKITAADDGTTADITFAADDLKAGSGTYKVMLTDKTSDADVDSGEHVQLEAQPPADAKRDAAADTAPDASTAPGTANATAGDAGKKPAAQKKK